MKKTSRTAKPRCEPPASALTAPVPKRDVYRAARSYVASGLSLIPIRADGSKIPAFELLPRVWNEAVCRHTRPWGGYRARRPTRAELRAWFRDSDEARDYGIAVLGGAVSGGLEIIDCDNWDVGQRWSALVEKAVPGLLDRLVLVQTPRPGLHAYYRCTAFEGNAKLARVPDPAHDGKKPKTLIEVKGEGGYCLAPPSPPSCHATGRSYQFRGDLDLTQVATIEPTERAILLDCARRLNSWQEPERTAYTPQSSRNAQGQFERPGDDFNDRADWGDILLPHRWKWVARSGDGSDHWRRPGKARGTSATTNFGGSDLLYVFSANAHPFEESRGYTKFHAYALLEHGGDYSAAAAELNSLA